jgi:hypothetical protein
LNRKGLVIALILFLVPQSYVFYIDAFTELGNVVSALKFFVAIKLSGHEFPAILKAAKRCFPLVERFYTEKCGNIFFNI